MIFLFHLFSYFCSSPFLLFFSSFFIMLCHVHLVLLRLIYMDVYILSILSCRHNGCNLSSAIFKLNAIFHPLDISSTEIQLFPTS